jgi:hypothetical protein
MREQSGFRCSGSPQPAWEDQPGLALGADCFPKPLFNQLNYLAPWHREPIEGYPHASRGYRGGRSKPYHAVCVLLLYAQNKVVVEVKAALMLD